MATKQQQIDYVRWFVDEVSRSEVVVTCLWVFACVCVCGLVFLRTQQRLYVCMLDGANYKRSGFQNEGLIKWDEKASKHGQTR